MSTVKIVKLNLRYKYNKKSAVRGTTCISAPGICKSDHLRQSYDR